MCGKWAFIFTGAFLDWAEDEYVMLNQFTCKKCCQSWRD
jgi:hypothetical protein